MSFAPAFDVICAKRICSVAPCRGWYNGCGCEDIAQLFLYSVLGLMVRSDMRIRNFADPWLTNVVFVMCLLWTGLRSMPDPKIADSKSCMLRYC